ncbi:MAG: family acetyltransferase [Acidimicrobiaceae bacterium]|jgi:RimJ/RimL family protein N-acetyltransferase|nr:family acetyltransferase [Acidimicrobiaceae bacterium]
MNFDGSEVFVPATDSRPVDAPWPAMTWPPSPLLRLRGRVVEVAQFETAGDAEELFESVDHDAVWRHVAGRPHDVAALVALIDRGAALGRISWVARLLSPHAGLGIGAVVGTSSYLDASPADARLEIGSTMYTPAVWASAVNPDTKLQLLGFAFDVLSVGRVQLKTDVRNTRSQRAIARLGAQYEGTLRRYQRRDDGSVRDTAIFSITAEEWPAVRERLAARVEETVGKGT